MEQAKFQEAVALVGGTLAMARLLGVTQSAVSQVSGGRRRLPVHWCPIIERETGHAVRCEDLRQDVAWAVLRKV